MLKRVLLADNDLLSSSYLKLLSAWTEAGFVIHADVRGGDEALAVLENDSVDLVVTELELPRMSGVELIREIRKRKWRVCVLVLSCHGESAYIKEALEAGADGYLLKSTLNGSSLYAALCGIDARIRAWNEERRIAAEHVKEQDEERDARKYFYFSALLADVVRGEERERRRLEANVCGCYQSCAVIVLRPVRELTGDVLEEARTEHEHLEFLPLLQRGLKESGFPEEQAEAIYFAGVFCCFLDFADIDTSGEVYTRLTRAAFACQRLCRETKWPCAVGVSSLCLGTDAIREAYRQAREMLQLCFYEPEGVAFYTGNVETGHTLPREAEAMLDRLTYLCVQQDRETFRQCCAEAAAALRRERTERSLVLQWLQGLLRVSGLGEGMPLPPLVTAEELPPLLAQLEARLFQEEEQAAAKKLSEPVRAAAHYAEAHFREPIGLSDAAAAAGVSSSYLSALFRQEMGIGFAHFLQNLRLSCAKRLLRDSSLRLQEAADSAGFHDYSYFSRVFKRKNGISPAEYRKSRDNRTV